MCGIAGILSRDPSQGVDRGRLEAMRDVLRHRGPDGEGTWLEGGVGLAHRRLAIVDVSGGRQPMASEDEAARIGELVLDAGRSARSTLARRDVRP